MIIETNRLILRPWKDSDYEGFYQLNTDPQVMEFFPELLSRPESDALADRIVNHFNEHGYGLWAVERKDNTEFIGFTGLNCPTWEASFTPCVEIGWRLAHSAWGHGFAPEAALASLNFGFESLGLKEILAFTVPKNIRSRRVMEKIGMHHDRTADFYHPKISRNHPLSLHVLYRLSSSGLRT